MNKMLRKFLKKFDRYNNLTNKKKNNIWVGKRKPCCFRNKENISMKEAIEILKTNQNTILLDVRSNQEYQEGHLQGSINIPLYDIPSKASLKLKNKEAVIITYCSAGIRSEKALKLLRKLGYRNLYTIEGGIDIYE